MTTLSALLLVTAFPGGDLADRLKARLRELDVERREQVLEALERLPSQERPRAAEAFLRGDDPCSKLRKRAIRFVGERMRKLSDEEKRELAKCFLEFYKSLPEDVRKEMLKTIQSEFFKGVAPKKDK